MLLPSVGIQESLAEDTVDSSGGGRGNFVLASQLSGAEVSSEVPPCTKASFNGIPPKQLSAILPSAPALVQKFQAWSSAHESPGASAWTLLHPPAHWKGRGVIT